ncbi:MAG: hypothetical protein R2698_11775 [Microthrixaceae bacterium]
MGTHHLVDGVDSLVAVEAECCCERRSDVGWFGGSTVSGGPDAWNWTEDMVADLMS